MSDLLGWEGEAAGECGSGGLECQALRKVIGCVWGFKLSIIERDQQKGPKSGKGQFGEVNVPLGLVFRWTLFYGWQSVVYFLNQLAIEAVKSCLKI